MACDDHGQWWPSEVTEHNLRNLTMPLDEDGLLLLVEDCAYGLVDFVEDDSLVNEAHVEYDSRVFRKTKDCALENARGSGSGIGIFVSVSLSHSPACVLIFGFGSGPRVRSIPEGGRLLWRG